MRGLKPDDKGALRHAGRICHYREIRRINIEVVFFSFDAVTWART
jgi:hypothetical protein